MKLPIYMDHHATTPVDPRVLEAMLPYFAEKFGNAASTNHPFGWEAHDAVETARQQIAGAIGASPDEIIFTSGATESNNLALHGVASQYASKGDHFITSQIEHSAILDTARNLEQAGVSVTYISVGPDGIVDPEVVRRAITDRTILISVMHANNEIGSIQPIRAISQLAREHGILFHTDAAQSLGKIPLDVGSDFVDLMSMSAHKVYGPKGIGALYVRRGKPRVRLSPLIHGGGHERGLRSGTLPVPLIVGFGKAIEIAVREMNDEATRVAGLRDRLKALIFENLDDVFVNGSAEFRLWNNLNLSFAHIDGESVLLGMPEVALSTGAACSSAEPEASHVLKALGLPPERLNSSIRFGLGRFNTEAEVNYVAEKLSATVKHLRALSPLRALTKESVHPSPTAKLDQ